jgi:multicomponent Na+:H+ antiporter subunit E
MLSDKVRNASLAIVLLVFWLVLSGHYTTWLISLGVLSVLGCVALAHRMQLIDAEGHPVQLGIAALTFFPWLIWEILKSGWSVTRIILSPQLPISPTVISLKASQRTSVGVATYANSITLTPGTITIQADGSALCVHALTDDGALDLKGGGMDARITRFEGIG